MEENKRLIDAGKLMEEPVWKCGGDPYDQYYMGYQDALDNVEVTIDAQPTVDVVEVVHGRWISLTECANAGVYCSVCHKKVWKEDYAWCNRKNKIRSNYCPHCGAKMDGGEAHE